jgi:glycosyltransferase involved in cell wall biosynthesis
MPRVSVVIPSYNHGSYIAEAAESVLRQSISDLELIIVDDGSTDDTLDKLNSFSDQRLRIISQANKGAHAAINRGLHEASGEFLSILNSDDAYSPSRLARILEIMNSEPQAGLIGSYIEIIDSQGRTLGVKHGYDDCPPWQLEHPKRSFRAGGDLRAALLTENYWATTSNFVIRRSLYEQVGEFRPLRYTHDWDFALRAARHSKLVLIPEPLVRYRIHATNTIRENQVAMIFDICWCLAVNLPDHIRDPWFSQAPTAERINQLYYSLYSFGMDRVVSLMLMQGLADHPEMALSLLDPDDSCRSTYMKIIAENLAP